MRLAQSTFAVLILLLQLASAWSWSPAYDAFDEGLVRRQDDTASTSSIVSSNVPDTSESSLKSDVASETGSPASNSAAATTDGSASPSTAKKTVTDSGSAAPTAAATNGTATHAGNSTVPLTTATSVPANAPAGGISLISPAAATTTYYKIGTNVTLAWNYTSLLVPPTAIDVVVSNTASTYTLASNASVAATATIFWDTSKYAGQENPLENSFYTLVVFDADAGITALPSPGHLSPYGINAQFGMYSPQPYQSLDAFVCVTCNGAASLIETQTMRFLTGMFVITIATFAYFASDFLHLL